MTGLARKLRLIDYFALGFGVTVGTAWLVTMDDLLARGGSVGAILGFRRRRHHAAAHRLCVWPVGPRDSRCGRRSSVHRQVLVAARQLCDRLDDVSELLSDFPFEALAAGRIAGYLFPSLNSFELYRLGGRPVYLPQMALGLVITVLLTWLNWRGIEASARFLKGTTFLFLGFVLVFALAGAKHGALSNLSPLFSRAPLISIFLVWQGTRLFGGHHAHDRRIRGILLLRHCGGCVRGALANAQPQ